MTKQQTRARQSQVIADMLRAMQSAPRTLRDLESLTGMKRDSLRAWVQSFESVGLIEKRGPRTGEAKGGRVPQTWGMS